MCNKYLAGKILANLGSPVIILVKSSMATCTPLCFEFSVELMVWGYHVYQDECDVVIGEELQCCRETDNRHDPYALATLRAGRVIGHMARKISPLCSIFIQRGGCITCTVSD